VRRCATASRILSFPVRSYLPVGVDGKDTRAKAATASLKPARIACPLYCLVKAIQNTPCPATFQRPSRPSQATLPQLSIQVR
jgi:hypothetical protein